MYISGKNKILIITGPTAVGKTDFALNLANKIDGEIVNIDVGQFYQPLTIGSAKPDWKNEKINHHLFDIIEEPKDLDVLTYRKLLKKTLNEIWKKNKLPIITGGSGFYIQSLFFPPLQVSNFKTEKIKVQDSDLWEKLSKIDPLRAEKINKNDVYRLQRALEIYKKSGVKPSSLQPNYDPICEDFKIIILTRNREELYKRIDERTKSMIEHGWIKEVESLNEKWINFLKTKKIIGYNEIILYLQNEIDKDNLIDLISKKTRNYAKRQLTFFRYLQKNVDKFSKDKIFWCNLSEKENFDKFI